MQQVGIRLCVVHGGGKQLTELASLMGVEQTIVRNCRPSALVMLILVTDKSPWSAAPFTRTPALLTINRSVATISLLPGVPDWPMLVVVV